LRLGSDSLITKKLFYTDPYICSAKCEIEDIFEKNGKFEIVLKSTPFYPEGGGQPCDKGQIDGIDIEYVYEDEDVIYHVVAQKPTSVSSIIDTSTGVGACSCKGIVVECIVDYKRRFDHIQQHSGEHLLSGAFFKLYKAVNAGFHLGQDYITIDMEHNNLTEDMIKKAEAEANSYIYKNEPIKTYFMSKDEALKLPLRKEVKAEGNIRIVKMGDGTDYSACCGTHVKYTGEVGIIKILKFENYKGMTRLYIKCGLRALQDYNQKHEDITFLAKKFSTEVSDVVNKVTSQTELIADLKMKLVNISNKLAAKEAEELIKNADSSIIINEYEEEGFEFLEKLYDQLKGKAYTLILSSLKENRLLFAHTNEPAPASGATSISAPMQNKSVGIDCGKVLKESLKDFNGRGGGNSNRAQASFTNNEELKKYANYLISSMKQI
jgi:alanyl-tRNA synthetase